MFVFVWCNLLLLENLYKNQRDSFRKHLPIVVVVPERKKQNNFYRIKKGFFLFLDVESNSIYFYFLIKEL